MMWLLDHFFLAHGDGLLMLNACCLTGLRRSALKHTNTPTPTTHTPVPETTSGSPHPLNSPGARQPPCHESYSKILHFRCLWHCHAHPMRLPELCWMGRPREAHPAPQAHAVTSHDHASATAKDAPAGCHLSACHDCTRAVNLRPQNPAGRDYIKASSSLAMCASMHIP